MIMECFQYVCLSVCLSVCLTCCLPVLLSDDYGVLPVHLSVCLSVLLVVCLSCHLMILCVSDFFLCVCVCVYWIVLIYQITEQDVRILLFFAVCCRFFCDLLSESLDLLSYFAHCQKVIMIDDAGVTSAG